MTLEEAKKKFPIGTWVRFYNNGNLVIGAVNYVRGDGVLNTPGLCTDIGPVSPDSVIESRTQND